MHCLLVPHSIHHWYYLICHAISLCIQDRCRWAESIYRQQKHRRLSRERFLRRLGEEVARLEREAASESARRERYGPSHYDRIGARLGGGGGGGDAMGYYR